MERIKNSKSYICFLIILIVIIFCLVGFIVCDKFLYKEPTNEEITTTNKVKEETDIIRRDNFIYELNNKDINISYIYRKMNSNKFALWKENSENIEIKNNSEIYNMIYLEILVNEKKLDIEKIPLFYNFKEDSLNKINLLSSDTIKTLKGEGSEYLVFLIEHAGSFGDGGINPFIVNENNDILYTLKFKDNTGWWTTDENSIMYDKGEYYLTNDTFYYLMPSCERTSGNGLYFDQYSLKITNDKIVNQKVGTYKGEAAGGAVCES